MVERSGEIERLRQEALKAAKETEEQFVGAGSELRTAINALADHARKMERERAEADNALAACRSEAGGQIARLRGEVERLHELAACRARAADLAERERDEYRQRAERTVAAADAPQPKPEAYICGKCGSLEYTDEGCSEVDADGERCDGPMRPLVCLPDTAADARQPDAPRIAEYDGAYKCLECGATWGAIQNATGPCEHAADARQDADEGETT